MSRRILAMLAAVVLAALAAFLIISYLNQADQRAMEDMSPETVLVVTEPVPEGFAAEDLGDYLTVEEVPSAAVVPGGVQSLDEIAGQVTVADLHPGEQLLAARFASPEELAEAREVPVPEGYHEVTVQLPTARVIGGHLTAGDTVGFFASSDEQTRLRLHQVLVTRVEGGVGAAPTQEGEEEQAPREAGDSVMVTLAAEASDVQLIVNAAEFHGVWLSVEPPEAPDDELETIGPEDLFG